MLIVLHVIARATAIRALWLVRERYGSFFILQDQVLTVCYDIFLLGALLFVQINTNSDGYIKFLTFLFLTFYMLSVIGTILFALYLRGYVGEETPRKIVRWVQIRLLRHKIPIRIVPARDEPTHAPSTPPDPIDPSSHLH